MLMHSLLRRGWHVLFPYFPSTGNVYFHFRQDNVVQKFANLIIKNAGFQVETGCLAYFDVCQHIWI